VLSAGYIGLPFFVVGLAFLLTIAHSLLEPSEPASRNYKRHFPEATAYKQDTDTDSAAMIGAPDHQASSGQNEGQSNDDSLWLILFTGIAAAATGAIAIFNWQLVGVTREMVKATGLAAEAARLALHVNRPYLMVVGMTPLALMSEVLHVQEPISRLTINLHNVGSSPAELTEILAGSWKFDCVADMTEPRWERLIHAPQDIARSVLAVGGELDPIRITIHWTEEHMASVNCGAKRVAIYGVVRYRSGPKESYYTRFFYWFSPLTRPELQKAASEELNERA